MFKPGPFPLILMRCYPLHRCPSLSHAFSVGPIRFGLSPCLCIPLLTNRSYSSGTAEVATKIATSWSNVIDAPNEDQCGLFDVGAPTKDQRGPLDAPNDSQCAPNEPVVATSEAFELTDTVRIHHTICPECSP